MKIPFTQYTKSNNINLAYQVFGSGPIDLVYIPSWISHIDLMWACPELAGFFEELGKIARVIIFDKRGTGLSDRSVELSTIEEQIEDINAVMDAVESKEAVFFGHSEGGCMSALFSATYPEKVIALISFGIFAKGKYSHDYPWAPTEEAHQKVYNIIENHWCSEKMELENLAPSKANDEMFMSWLSKYFRSGASPTTALKLAKRNAEVNIIDVLKFINVPTLVMQRTNDNDVKIEEGKFIHKHIKKSKFVELEGSDHLFWTGDAMRVLDEIRNFIETNSIKLKKEKGLRTILFGQITNISKSSKISKKIERYIEKHSTGIIFLDKQCFAIRFNTPGRAIDCGLGLLEIVKKTETSIRLGAYMKEDVKGIANALTVKDKKVIKSMLSNITKNQFLITETIKNLLTGANLDFIPNASVLNYFSKKTCKLFVIKKNSQKLEIAYKRAVINNSYDTFLENIINIIEDNIDDNNFNVETLRKKIGLSERQLQRKVKELTGKSPNQFIINIRLNKAKEVLLSLAESNISEVAFQFGFSSPSYFSKCFRKEFGTTPRILKDNIRNSMEELQIVAS